MIDNNAQKKFETSESNFSPKEIKILFAGGGTLGSVSPLIAIWQYLKTNAPALNCLFVGTKKGPEKEMFFNYQLPYKILPVVKLRRYFSWRNFWDIFKLIYVLVRSIAILYRYRPDIIVSAGGFTAVPLIWATVFFKKIKVVVYQSDFKAGLTNKLSQPLADFIFVAFSETVKEFPVHKTIITGSIIREECKSVRKTPSEFGARKQILVLGGGSGAIPINDLICQAAPELSRKYVINHVTGKDKNNNLKLENYHSYELLTGDYYQKIADADLVISRSGLSTLMELSQLYPPTILIPLPDSPQEMNANYFCRKRAAVCLDQKTLTPKILADTIESVLGNDEELKRLKKSLKNIFLRNGEEKIAKIIVELCK